jgi:hypothetical protein
MMPLAVVLLIACATAPADAGSRLRVLVDPVRAPLAAEVDERFVSFAVDIDQLVGGTFWDPAGGEEEVRVAPYDFSRPALRNLTAALAPAYLRLGGSASDVTYYDLGDVPGAAPAPYQEVLTRAQWDGASAFARELGLEIILTVNAGAGPRDGAGVWTDTNARALLAHVAGRGDPVSVLEWGNEPNLFGVRAGLGGYQVAYYVRDFTTFRALAATVLPTARLAGPGNIYTRLFADTLVAGIAFGPRTHELLPAIGPTLDVVTYHYYAAVSTRCLTVQPRVTPETALEAAYLDGIDEPSTAVAALRDLHAPGAPIWMMESGGQSCGGQIGLGDRFLNSFWYLNSLARMARAGQPVAVRQTLSGSTYGLIDDVSLTPRPDYWAALLWRRLMGRRALALAEPGPDAAALRLYAHCRRDGRPGDVTVLALNTSPDTPVRLKLRRRGTARARLYLVTATAPDAGEVLLNGAPLAAAADGTPPAFRARKVRGTVTIPPLAYAFVELPKAGAAACE